VRQTVRLPLFIAPFFGVANFYTHYFNRGDSLADALLEGGSLLVVCGILWLWPALLDRLASSLKLEGFRGLTFRLVCGCAPPLLFSIYLFIASQEPLERSIREVLGHSAGQVLFGWLVMPACSASLAVAHYLVFSAGAVFRRR
jgi:hypothetical protein